MAPQERPVEPGAVRLDAPGRAEQLVGRVKQREDAGLSGHPRENRGGPPLRHSADYTQFPHQRTAGQVGERSGGGTCEFYLVRTVQPAHQVPKRRDIRARRRRQEAIEFPRCHHRGWPGPGAAMIVDRVSDRRTSLSSAVVTRICRPGVSTQSRSSAVSRATASSSWTSSDRGLSMNRSPGCVAIPCRCPIRSKAATTAMRSWRRSPGDCVRNLSRGPPVLNTWRRPARSTTTWSRLRNPKLRASSATYAFSSPKSWSLAV